MDGPALHTFGRGLFVDGLAQQVKDAAQALVAHGHGDGAAGIHGFQTAHHAVGGVHGNAAGHVVANVLRHLGHDLAIAVLNFNGGKQFGQLAVLEADVQHRADDLNHLADVFRAHDGKTPFLTRSVLRASHDFRDLLGDGALAGTVVPELEVGDHLSGVLGGGIHALRRAATSLAKASHSAL